MKRRTFLQMLAAAFALPFGSKKVGSMPDLQRSDTYDGFAFIEDPSPLRFVIKPLPGNWHGTPHELFAHIAENVTFLSAATPVGASPEKESSIKSKILA